MSLLDNAFNYTPQKTSPVYNSALTIAVMMQTAFEHVNGRHPAEMPSLQA